MSDLPYREKSEVPNYFNPPPTEKISYEEYKEAKSYSDHWRGLQIFSFFLMGITSSLAAYLYPMGQYWPIPPFFVAFAFCIFCNGNANFHRRVVMQYKRMF